MREPFEKAYSQCTRAASAGYALLIYNFDPSTPHQHAEATMSDHLRTGYAAAIGMAPSPKSLLMEVAHFEL